MSALTQAVRHRLLSVARANHVGLSLQHNNRAFAGSVRQPEALLCVFLRISAVSKRCRARERRAAPRTATLSRKQRAALDSGHKQRAGLPRGDWTVPLPCQIEYFSVDLKGSRKLAPLRPCTSRSQAEQRSAQRQTTGAGSAGRSDKNSGIETGGPTERLTLKTRPQQSDIAQGCVKLARSWSERDANRRSASRRHGSLGRQDHHTACPQHAAYATAGAAQSPE